MQGGVLRQPCGLSRCICGLYDHCRKLRTITVRGHLVDLLSRLPRSRFRSRAKRCLSLGSNLPRRTERSVKNHDFGAETAAKEVLH
jgi:hypothetical protein